MKDTLQSIGAILAFVTFAWRIAEGLMSHVKLDIEIQEVVIPSNNRHPITAVLKIQNDGKASKLIHYAAMIIVPSGVSLREAADRILGGTNKGTVQRFQRDPIELLSSARSLTRMTSSDNAITLVPLPFFFSEQMTIGNEVVKQRVELDTSSLDPSIDYTVFFVAYQRYPMNFLVRWRVTSETLFLR
jgi:hypothetical protein